jgi:uncharacterized protein YcfJ
LKKIKIASILTILFLSGCASTDSNRILVVGKVISSVSAPEKCFEKTRNSNGDLILSSIVGGVIGNQFGKGKGRVAMTAAGVAAGAAISNVNTEKNKGKYICKSQGFISTIKYLNPYNGMNKEKTISTNYRKRIGTMVELKIDKN